MPGTLLQGHFTSAPDVPGDNLVGKRTNNGPKHSFRTSRKNAGRSTE